MMLGRQMAGKSTWMTGILLCLISSSIEPFYINCIVDGKEILRFGKHHRNDENSRTFFISRDGYERLLRRLVLSSSSRIKWITGTVTKFNVNPEDISILSSVDIRLPDGTRDVVPAALVAGSY